MYMFVCVHVCIYTVCICIYIYTIYIYGFLDWRDPQVTMVISILKWPSMTWMIWGYPHNLGNLYGWPIRFNNIVDSKNPTPPWMVETCWNAINPGRNHIATGAGFLPSTICDMWVCLKWGIRYPNQPPSMAILIREIMSNSKLVVFPLSFRQTQMANDSYGSKPWRQ